MNRPITAGAAVLALLLGATTGAPARQAATQDPAVTQGLEAEAPAMPSPSGAFVRSMVFPGWGQAVFGASTRGGVYFAARVASGAMLYKTVRKLSAAREMERNQVAFVVDSVMTRAAADSAFAEQIQEPGAVDQIVDRHPRTVAIRGLVEAREQQREDWITWSIFWLLASAADAYVTAQLADFPAQVSAQPNAGGGMRFKVTVPAGGRP